MHPDGFEAVIGIIFMRMEAIQKDGIALPRGDMAPFDDKGKAAVYDMCDQ